MIWLWTPGLNTDRSIADPPVDLTNMANDRDIPITAPRTHIILRNPDYIDDIKKPFSITTRRSMNDRVRSYISRDRLDMSAYTMTLAFHDLHIERREALEHFVLSSDGQYVGYQDPVGRKHVGFLDAPETTFTSEGRDQMYDNEGFRRESYISTTSLTLYLLSHEGHEL